MRPVACARIEKQGMRLEGRASGMGGGLLGDRMMGAGGGWMGCSVVVGGRNGWGVAAARRRREAVAAALRFSCRRVRERVVWNRCARAVMWCEVARGRAGLRGLSERASALALK